MKNQFSKILLAGGVVCALALPACAQLKAWATRPGTVETIQPAQTNQVTTVATNAEEIAAATNGATGEVVPAHVALTLVTNVTPVIQPAILFTNLVLAPALQGGITAADTIASASGVPWSHTVAEGVLALASILLAWANSNGKRKLEASISDHANTLDALSNAQEVSATLVQNFEQLRQVALTVPGYTRDIDDKVMTAIQTVQEIAGVKSDVNDLVDAHTSTTIPGAGAIAAK